MIDFGKSLSGSWVHIGDDFHEDIKAAKEFVHCDIQTIWLKPKHKLEKLSKGQENQSEKNKQNENLRERSETENKDNKVFDASKTELNKEETAATHIFLSLSKTYDYDFIDFHAQNLHEVREVLHDWVQQSRAL